MSTAGATLQPIRVSPLVRVGRWSLLAVGVLYGISRQRTLSKRETKLREIEAQERPAKEAAAAVKKAKSVREELIYLAKETGTPIPPNF